MPTPVSERVQKRRDALRAAGLRPVQIWVPDTSSIRTCRISWTPLLLTWTSGSEAR